MSKGPRRAFARLGWLVTTIALATALVVSSWLNYRGARSAVVALNRGQAVLLEATVRDALMRPEDGTIGEQDLRELTIQHEAAGLRYVAVTEDSAVKYSAGTAVLPFSLPVRGGPPGPDGDDSLTPVSDRVRVVFPQPSVRRFTGAPGDSTFRNGMPGVTRQVQVTQSLPDGRGPSQQGRQFDRMRHWVILEVEPVLANALITRAERSLAIAAIGATILTLAALLFWRTSEQYAAARVRLEEQRRLTVLGEMSAVLAHEIRNPLASLKGNAQLLAERMPADSKEKARADRVVSEATRLEALTTDLLDFARTGTGQMRDTDPAQLMTTSIGDVAEDGFTLDATSAPPSWPMDATRMRQTLVNILENARQATPDGRAPAARVALEGSSLVYEVRDFGPGLQDDAAERIFDPFFTTRTNGTGLGLAVARRAVELHGGTISAKNHPEGGAVFRIVLPRPA